MNTPSSVENLSKLGLVCRQEGDLNEKPQAIQPGPFVFTFPSFFNIIPIEISSPIILLGRKVVIFACVQDMVPHLADKAP